MKAIHVGIGGWNFAPWRGTFYPNGLTQAKELAYASSQVTSIEINGTFYGSQKPESFRKWRDETPNDFVFSVKGPRFSTHRSDLTEARESVMRFLGTGVLELGPKLGAMLWQFPPTRRFDADGMRPFLTALPAKHDGQPLRHVIEARHPTFDDPAWFELLSEFGVANAIVESDKHWLRADATAEFMYARLERNAADQPEGYASTALDAWAARIRQWASGQPVTDLSYAAAPSDRPPGRECFIYFISGDKVRAPDAAQALLRRLAE